MKCIKFNDDTLLYIIKTKEIEPIIIEIINSTITILIHVICLEVQISSPSVHPLSDKK